MATQRQFHWLFRRKPAVTAQEFIGIPIHGLDDWIVIYVNSLETSKTTDHCLCQWKVHPDDVDKPKGQRRVARSDQHPRCPAHTREGLILGFMEYMRKNG
jgi:hypothetical protein